jgi:hypothetical protein
MLVCVTSPRPDTTQYRTQCVPCWKQFPRCHAGVLFVPGLEATHASVVAILRGGHDCLSYDSRRASIRVTCRETESETRTPSPHKKPRSLTSRISLLFLFGVSLVVVFILYLFCLPRSEAWMSSAFFACFLLLHLSLTFLYLLLWGCVLSDRTQPIYNK